MKKICVILPTKLPVPAVLGGAVESLVEKVIDENEINHKYDFTIITIFNKEAYKLSKKYKNTKFLTFHLNMKLYKVNNFLYSIYKELLKRNFKYTLESNAAEKILKNIKNFDYVIIDGGDPNMIFHVSKYYPKNKILFHTHGSIMPTIKLDQSFNYLITVSNYIADVWRKTSTRPHKKIKILKNCIDIKNFSRTITESQKTQLLKTLGIAKNDFVVMLTGRIVAEKGVKELIQAINQIEDKNITLLIIGSSNFGTRTNTPYEQEIQRLINKSNKKIIFTGFIHNSQLYKYYQLSDIVVVPSIWEDPAPLVPIEAMASGRPLIVTHSGGILEYVTKDCAIILEKDDMLVKNLANEIIYLKDNPKLMKEMSDVGKCVASQYDISNYFNDFCKIIEEIDKNEDE